MGVIDFKSDWQSKKEIVDKERKAYADKKAQAFDNIKPASKEVNVPKNPLMKGFGKPEKSSAVNSSFMHLERG